MDNRMQNEQTMTYRLDPISAHIDCQGVVYDSLKSKQHFWQETNSLFLHLWDCSAILLMFN